MTWAVKFDSLCQSRHTNLKFDRSCQRQPPTWLCGLLPSPWHLPPLILLYWQPPPTPAHHNHYQRVVLTRLVSLPPSQHLCLNTEDHNHHQRVVLTRWWALLPLNLERQPPPPPTSHFDSLVGLTPSQPASTTKNESFWPVLRPLSHLPATTTTNESLRLVGGFSSSSQPPTSKNHPPTPRCWSHQSSGRPRPP